MKRNQSGFTLIEIAIVLVIIGLLLGGVLKGQELINSAKVKNLAGDFKNIPVFIYGYQDKFKALPGDDAAVVAHVNGTLATAPASPAARGNGVIEGQWNSTTAGDESVLFWQHVRLAGLAPGETTVNVAAGNTYIPTNAAGGKVGIQSGSTTAPPVNDAAGNPIRGSYVICSDGILGKFVKGNNSLITMPPQVLAMHQKLLEKIIKIRGEYSEDSDLNRVENGNSQSTIGIITSGISYSYVQEALKEMGIKIPILKLGFFYPLPVKKIAHFLKKFEKVLVVEELEPYLEKEIKEVCYGENIKTKVFGKSLLPEVGELSTEHVVFALSELAGKMSLFTNTVNVKTVKHIPRFCSGKTGACPYWKLYSAIKEVVPKDAIFGGDIGCYMMAALPPHNLYDYLLNMGSSIGIAHGIKKVSSQKVVAFMGDGTFFHSGISSIINCVYNKSNPLVIIMDNEITAMTGHQPNPGSEVKIEEILKAIGVKNIRVLDEEAQYDELKKTIKEFLNKDSISVIVAKKICWLLAARKN